MLEQFCDSKKQIGSFSCAPYFSTVQQAYIPVSSCQVQLNTFYLCENDATFFWLNWRCIERACILENLCFIEVEQSTTILVLFVEIHLSLALRRSTVSLLTRTINRINKKGRDVLLARKNSRNSQRGTLDFEPVCQPKADEARTSIRRYNLTRTYFNMAAVNSLRKKTKGVQSLPRRQSVYHGMAEGSSQPLPPPPRVRPKDKSKVESLMKRRYSTRGLPQNLNIEPFPAELSTKSRTTDSNFSDTVNSPFFRVCYLY